MVKNKILDDIKTEADSYGGPPRCPEEARLSKIRWKRYHAIRYKTRRITYGEILLNTIICTFQPKIENNAMSEQNIFKILIRYLRNSEKILSEQPKTAMK
jgi:hypothetical protein